MYRLRMESCLVLGAALLAGCSERNTPTLLAPRPLAATAAVDRPYTWSFTCNGSGTIGATWDWTYTDDASGAMTVISHYDSWCPPDQSNDPSNPPVRPGQANGFTATVGEDKQSFRFDPAGPFTATVKGSVHIQFKWRGTTNYTKHGTLTVDS